MTTSPLVNTLVLAGLLLATWMNWSWPWGALFIYWTIPAIRFGEGPSARPGAEGRPAGAVLDRDGTVGALRRDDHHG